jgi:hypothetical protein
MTKKAEAAVWGLLVVSMDHPPFRRIDVGQYTVVAISIGFQWIDTGKRCKTTAQRIGKIE